MSGLFSTPTASVPTAPPPAPTAANSYASEDQAARQAAISRQRGLTSTLLTGGYGVNDSGNTSRVLLGGR